MFHLYAALAEKVRTMIIQHTVRYTELSPDRFKDLYYQPDATVLLRCHAHFGHRRDIRAARGRPAIDWLRLGDIPTANGTIATSVKAAA
jgi:hypothetical protein